MPAEYGPAKTLYNRWRRWSEAGVFERIFKTLARETADLSTLMIPLGTLLRNALPAMDAHHVKTHRIAANGVKKTRRTGGASAGPKAG